MNKITSYSADYQTFTTLFELEPVACKKVTVDFFAPELSSLGGLSLVREYEKPSNASSNASNPVSKIRVGNLKTRSAQVLCYANKQMLQVNLFSLSLQRFKHFVRQI